MNWSVIGQRLAASANDLVVVVLAAVAIYVWVIAANRLLGLRSFAKMSAYDFAMTVAIGSTIASVALGSASLAAGALAVAVLFLSQYTVSLLRRRTPADHALDNRPLLLLHEGQVIDHHLAKARLTRGDLMGKLRAAGVRDISEVRAVVFETTGDVSVLQGTGPVDPNLLDGVEMGDG